MRVISFLCCLFISSTACLGQWKYELNAQDEETIAYYKNNKIVAVYFPAQEILKLVDTYLMDDYPEIVNPILKYDEGKINNYTYDIPYFARIYNGKTLEYYTTGETKYLFRGISGDGTMSFGDKYFLGTMYFRISALKMMDNSRIEFEHINLKGINTIYSYSLMGFTKEYYKSDGR